jgi:hypothetical protein
MRGGAIAGVRLADHPKRESVNLPRHEATPRVTLALVIALRCPRPRAVAEGASRSLRRRAESQPTILGGPSGDHHESEIRQSIDRQRAPRSRVLFRRMRKAQHRRPE